LRKFITAFVFALSLTAAFADDVVDANIDIQQNPISCAGKIFSDVLAANISEVKDSDPEYVIRGWIYKNFQDPKIIQQVLNCPEFANAADDETIKLPTVVTNLPLGRQITINYETQPKILKQRLLLKNKMSLPETNPSPKIGATDDPAVWTNTEPAWYGVLVVQHGALDNFVGENKNNTISLKYIEQNIDKIYPSNDSCTSRSALANKSDIINIAGHKTVNLKDDSNDYYVAGDINLHWVTWAEVSLDVAITLATVGTGTVVLGTTKAVRASKAAKNTIVIMKDLEKAEKVQEYIKLTQKSSKVAEELEKIDKAKDAAGYAAKSDEIENLGKDIKELEKIEDVEKYKDASKSFEDVMKFRRELKAWRIPQRGNVVARLWKSLRAANTGGKTIRTAEKIGKASSFAGRTRDFLFRSTLKNIGRLGRMQQASGILYGTLKFAGDMYDWTETSTGDFTSNIQFKPLGLLSADDLAGQENIVNYGMWLMWAGDSVNPADDDAAYLQAMDFADKFHQDLIEIQEDKNSNDCSVDLYVVRPIVRNPDTPDAQLYYLIMNDQPWSTSEK